MGRGADAGGRNNKANRDRWLGEINDVIFGKKFKDNMTHGWNLALAQLMKVTAPAAAAAETVREVEPDFSFDGKRPTTQEDVKRILFSEEVIRMVHDGRMEQAIALLYKWVYYLTMEGCKLNWISEATSEYMRSMEYKVELGRECARDIRLSMHSIDRIGKKSATNSFVTGIKREIQRKWGIEVLMSSVIHEDDEDLVSGKMEVVDIKSYLPRRVLSDMTRKDGTFFQVRHLNAYDVDVTTRMNAKVDEIVHWAREQSIDEASLQSSISECFSRCGAKTSNDDMKSTFNSFNSPLTSAGGKGAEVGVDGESGNVDDTPTAHVTTDVEPNNYVGYATLLREEGGGRRNQ